jgi:hypothetical protein
MRHKTEEGGGHSLGELHPGQETTVMAYLVVVGGGNAGAEYSNGNKYEGAKIAQESQTKFRRTDRKEKRKSLYEAAPPR